MNNNRVNNYMEEKDFRDLAHRINGQFEALLAELRKQGLKEAGWYVDLGLTVYMRNVAKTLEIRYKQR